MRGKFDGTAINSTTVERQVEVIDATLAARSASSGDTR